MECPLSFSAQGKRSEFLKRCSFVKYGPLWSHGFINDFYPRIKGPAKKFPFWIKSIDPYQSFWKNIFGLIKKFLSRLFKYSQKRFGLFGPYGHLYGWFTSPIPLSMRGKYYLWVSQKVSYELHIVFEKVYPYYFYKNTKVLKCKI